MNKTLNQLFIVGFVICIGILVSSTSLYAQEKTGFGNEENLKGQDELTSSTEPSGNSISNGNNSLLREKEMHRDSLSLKSASPIKSKPEAPNSAKKPEDETLSYNLLYFIIQKFKVSDMLN